MSDPDKSPLPLYKVSPDSWNMRKADTALVTRTRTNYLQLFCWLRWWWWRSALCRDKPTPQLALHGEINSLDCPGCHYLVTLLISSLHSFLGQILPEWSAWRKLTVLIIIGGGWNWNLQPINLTRTIKYLFQLGLIPTRFNILLLMILYIVE